MSESGLKENSMIRNLTIALFALFTVFFIGCTIEVPQEEDGSPNNGGSSSRSPDEVEITVSTQSEWSSRTIRLTGPNETLSSQSGAGSGAIFIKVGDDVRRSVKIDFTDLTGGSASLFFSAVRDRNGNSIIYPFHVSTEAGMIAGSDGVFHETSGEYLAPDPVNLGVEEGLIDYFSPTLRVQGDPQSGRATVIISTPTFIGNRDPTQ